MEQASAPAGEARDDYDILRGVARHMGVEAKFSEGRTAEEWQRWIYDVYRRKVSSDGIEMPSLDKLRQKGWHEVPPPAKPNVMLEAFRADPTANPLRTPSGRIEIFSETVASFGYADCPGHPAWLEPLEWLSQADTRYPLHLISNQPSTKLHSQLDHGGHSRKSKIHGREPVTLHPDDAAARNISDGDIVRLFNDRGACLSAAIISNAIRPGVMQLPTGAWFDPLEPGQPGSLCKHGNPNMLTPDKGTSNLAQGPIAHTCMVEIERYDGELPTVTAFDPPEILQQR